MTNPIFKKDTNEPGIPSIRKFKPDSTNPNVKTREQQADDFWKMVISYTLSNGPIKFSKKFDNGEDVPKPEDSTILFKHIGELKNQVADWRASLENKKEGFHLVEFEDHYETHIDSVDPLKDPLGHLINDSPGTLVIAGIAVLAIGGLAYYFYKKGKNNNK